MVKNEPFQSEIIDGDILAIVLRGDLDSTSAPEFDRQIQGHLDAGRSKIIIDCRNMGYISSLGIGSLVALQTKLRRRGGEVKLAAIFGRAMDVIRLVHLDRMLDIHGDLEFARKSFYPSGPPTQP
jgi:anti-sigma B factor antagonist